MLTALSFLAKLLGIVLVSAILLLVIAVLLILFAPIRYKIDAEKSGDNWKLYVLMTYLNPVVRLTIRYPEERIVLLRLLGFVVYPRKGRETSKETSAKAVTISEEMPSKSDGTSSKSEGTSSKAKAASVKAPDKMTADAQESSSGDGQSRQAKSAQSVAAEENLKTDKRKHGTAAEAAAYYVTLLKENQPLILGVLNTILKALKTTLPKKGSIELVFGTGQPDVTGYLYAAFCSVCGFLPGDVTVIPVWTEAYLEGKCSLMGKIRLVHLITAWIKIRTDQDVQLLYKKIRSREYGSK